MGEQGFNAWVGVDVCVCVGYGEQGMFVWGRVGVWLSVWVSEIMIGMYGGAWMCGSVCVGEGKEDIHVWRRVDVWLCSVVRELGRRLSCAGDMWLWCFVWKSMTAHDDRVCFAGCVVCVHTMLIFM